MLKRIIKKFKFLIYLVALLVQVAFADDPMPGFLYEVDPKQDCPVLFNNDSYALSCEIGISKCVSEALEDGDRDLNFIYKKLIVYYEKRDKEENNETQLSKKLREAQRAWIKFRDAQCEVVGFYYYGSANGATKRQKLCHLTLTKSRLDELKKFVIYND
jgi:uncharacterized protein YecT (DUF1311 family)